MSGGEEGAGGRRRIFDENEDEDDVSVSIA